jgi:hypothetical protein
VDVLLDAAHAGGESLLFAVWDMPHHSLRFRLLAWPVRTLSRLRACRRYGPIREYDPITETWREPGLLRRWKRGPGIVVARHG